VVFAEVLILEETFKIDAILSIIALMKNCILKNVKPCTGFAQLITKRCSVRRNESLIIDSTAVTKK